ncbi:MAG TPA: acetate kinase [Candidatus Obscuribacterales bacterium]
MKILVLNMGSSTCKSSCYEVVGELPDDPVQPIWEASIDWGSRESGGELAVRKAGSPTAARTLANGSRFDGIASMLETLWAGPMAVVAQPAAIDVVGHRVVHGGMKHSSSTIVTAAVKADIAALEEFAPLHNKVNLEGIVAVERLLGTVRQVAVFDTTFHSAIPPAVAVYPGPYQWYESYRIKRYGFHGISHQYAAERAAHLLDRDPASLAVVTCHLGNGCSLAAVRGGRSVDTTMGFTPLEGLMMGTRSGSVDPGIIFYLLRQGKLSPEELERMLNHESGLKGISGLSNDMREIVPAAEAGNTRASLALDMFVHRVVTHAGAMTASLGGLDALVFTGGIGENAPLVRGRVCEKLAFLGISLDVDRNNTVSTDADIASPGATVRVLVIHAREDWAIARECWRLCAA